MPTGASATPSPFRTGLPMVETHPRSQFEQELWNDLASVVYFAEDNSIDSIPGGGSGFFCPIDIPCPVKCRLDITAQAFADTDADWDAWIQVDGVDAFRAEVTRQNNTTSILVSWFGCPDVSPGIHTVRIRVTPVVASDFYSKRVKVRRGRTPPG